MNLDPSPATGAVEPPQQVRAMFGRVAARYDVVNTVLSGGQDFLWRRSAAKIVRQWQPTRLLDLATGSGVLAASFAKVCPTTTIVGADFSLPMLQQAQATGRIARLAVADAMGLPFADDVFDAVTVGFGLRNMPSYGGALKEMCRVLRPGGNVLVLDFSLPRNRLCRSLYRLYLHHCLPHVAAQVCGEREAYRYLAESIERFPSRENMLALLKSSGFEAPTARQLTGGVVSLYTATKPIPSSS